MTSRLGHLLLGLPLWLGLQAGLAHAETVRLREGAPLEAEAVAFTAEGVEVTLRREGGTARILLPLARLDPDDILPLWDRTHSPYAAREVLASADLALRLGETGEAAGRYEVAYRLEAALKPERDAGLARIRAREAEAAVQDVESRVRSGHDLHGAVALARALLADDAGLALSTSQQRRIETLGRLAEKLALRAAARAASAATPPPAPEPPAPDVPEPAPPAAPAPAAEAPAAPDAVLELIRDRVGAFALRAERAREAAADVSLTRRRALRHLEDAAEALLLARRLVREAPDALLTDLATLSDDLRVALVGTWLELADLYRQEGLFEAARARVRAVLLLDPGNEHAWELRGLIEDDLRDSWPAAEGPAFETFLWSPSPFWGAYGCSPCHPVPTPYAVPRSRVRGVPRHGGVRRVRGHRR